MSDFEKLGVFYLGREYDLEGDTTRENLLLYDSKDLVTHAVCVGMTGSGKTGLCIGLLEEAVIDGIPAIIIDPKGDLPNLLLTFPSLKGKDFLPWVNEGEARKKGISVEEYADKQATLWKDGLAQWGQDGARIERFRNAADFAIYTPGSTAGLPVSILKSFAAPEDVILEDPDLLRERIQTTVTSLLNLVGVEADPIQSREHILLSSILDTAWKQKRDLDLAGFIQEIQSPPFEKVGVFDLESFFPSKDRFQLAMRLNNLLAAPGFQSWLEGEALDVNRLLYTEQGKPRVSIFSIAHLSDAERMFFVSLLLTQLLGWMRTQSGTSSLRCLFYMDEIFGYFPPVANPPSKAPLLTLLKQARAFGLGIVLASQNPVDIDYKGLSNAGTWFIGRLQTERDKERVLDGLSGVASSGGGRFNRKDMENILSSLGNRVFLMNNVHEDEPVLFQTRWVLSYLRGPLTRNQIKELMSGRERAYTVPSDTGRKDVLQAPKKGKVKAPAVSERPLLPPGIPQYFLVVSGVIPEDASVFYEPLLLGRATIYFSSAKIGIAAEKLINLTVEFPERSSRIKWDDGQEVSLNEGDLETGPEAEAAFGNLPQCSVEKKNYGEWAKSFRDWIYRNSELTLMKSPSLNIVSRPEEDERDFRIRLQMASREERDQLMEKIRKKYDPKIAQMEEKIRKAEQAVERESEQAKQQKLQTAISFGATVLSSLFGRKRVSRSSLGRAVTTARSAGRVLREGKDVERATESLEEYRESLRVLQQEFADELEKARTAIDPLTEQLETYAVKPRKMDIAVSLMALVWMPYCHDAQGSVRPAWKE